MKKLTGLFYRLRAWILGRKYFVGIDPAVSPDGRDVMIHGYVDRKGVMHVTQVLCE
jgi:hypothetical protein